VYLLKLDISKNANNSNLNKNENSIDINVLKELQDRIIDTTRILKRTKKSPVKHMIYNTYKNAEKIFIEGHYHQYKDFSQIILVMYYLNKYKKIDEDELEEI